MRINVMKKGDSILNVTDNMVVVKRRNGEVDVIPFYKSGKVYNFFCPVVNVIATPHPFHLLGSFQFLGHALGSFHLLHDGV